MDNKYKDVNYDQEKVYGQENEYDSIYNLKKSQYGQSIFSTFWFIIIFLSINIVIGAVFLVANNNLFNSNEVKDGDYVLTYEYRYNRLEIYITPNVDIKELKVVVSYRESIISTSKEEFILNDLVAGQQYKTVLYRIETLDAKFYFEVTGKYE